MARRILHVCESTAGGVGVFISALARHQLARGEEVGVAVPAQGPVPGELERAGARHFRFDVIPQPTPAVARELAWLRRIVREFDPSLVHLHSSKAGLVGRLLLRRRRPTVMQPHAWSFVARTGPVARATLAWERVAARWADVILCVSEDERRIGREAGVRADYRVLPNGVDLDDFPPPEPDARDAARKLLGLDGEPLAVCVGRLHRQKNQSALLDVWPRVREAVPDARLALLGDGPDREALAGRAVEGVDLVGLTDQVPRWLAAATLVAQPSRWEGMSLSVLEAMACARSVVVTDVPGMREVVADGTGAVVPPDDPGALAAALVERLRDTALADAEGRAGRARVEERHDRRRQIEAIDALYDEVVARRR